jgi:hypothetical protein
MKTHAFFRGIPIMPETQHSLSQINSGLVASTFLLASPHGLRGMFFDSQLQSTVGSSVYGAGLDVSEALGQKTLRRLPPIQHAWLYNCYSTATVDLSREFGIIGVSRNSAFMGFPMVVASRAQQASGGVISLSAHADRMFETWYVLSKDKTVTFPLRAALRAVNQQIVPQAIDANGGVSPMPLEMTGDGDSTFHSVYVANGESRETGPNRLTTWYYVHPDSRR